MTVKISGDNTVGAPGFSGPDADTGLYTGTDEVKIVTGGTARLTVDASGLVAAGNLVVDTNTLYVDAENNRVGIGTSTPSYLVDATRGASSGVVARFARDTGAGAFIYASASYAYVGGDASANTSIGFDSGNGNISFSTSNGTERARIDSSGRLLIGHVTTGSKGANSPLQVKSASDANCLTLKCRTNNDYAFITYTDDDASEGLAEIYVTRTGASNASLSFGTNNGSANSTERMRITNQGAMWAAARSTGLAAFGSSIHFHGFVQNSGQQWVFGLQNNGNEGDSGFGLYINYPNTAPNNTGNYFIYASDSSTVRFQVRSNGGVANYSGNNANLCDEREKKNIESLDSTWSCLKNWELKKFHYNEDVDTDDKRYGVIAQQVAPHCPEVITDWVKQKAEDAVLDEDGNVVTPAKEEIVRMGVKEQQMMWMAIKALQEAQLRIETLEAEVAALKTS